MVSDPLELSPRRLRAILMLAEQRSFIAAAAALKISQPALTRTVKQVERIVGVQLFLRTTRQVRITPAGREFVALAERLLADLELGVDSLRERSSRPTAQIVVSSVISLASALTTKTLTVFHREFTGTQFHFREGIHDDVLDDVGSGVADFGVGYVDGLPKAFIGATLAIDRLCAVMLPSHALATSASVELSSLRELELASFPPDSRTRRLLDGAAAAAGFAPRYVATTNRFATLLTLVRNGVGLAIVPWSEYLVARPRKLIARPLTGSRLASRLGILKLRQRELSGPAEALRGEIRKWLRDLTRAKA